MSQENFVTRDVFDSEIKRIEQKFDNAVERIELKMDAYTARMEGKFDTLNARVDGIVNFVGWTIALTSIIIAVGTFVIQILLK